MSDQGYVTAGNLADKTIEWLETIRPYYYDRTAFRFDPSQAALLVIDMQRYFVESSGRAFLPASRAILPGVVALVDAFNAVHRPVIWTRHGHAGKSDLGILGRFWSDHIRKGEPQWEIVDELEPKPGQPVVDKIRYDSFHRSGLDGLLRRRQVSQLVITGVMTHLCCETTARAAFVRDFEVYFTVDGTASSCEEFHLASLRTLANGAVVPTTVAQVAADLAGD